MRPRRRCRRVTRSDPVREDHAWASWGYCAVRRRRAKPGGESLSCKTYFDSEEDSSAMPNPSGPDRDHTSNAPGFDPDDVDRGDATDPAESDAGTTEHVGAPDDTPREG